MNAADIIKAKLDNIYDKADSTCKADIDELYKLIDAYENSNDKHKLEIGQLLHYELKNIGCISGCMILVEELIRQDPKNELLHLNLDISKEKLELLYDFWNQEGDMAALTSTNSKNVEKPYKILHVLNTSIPYLSNGYSIRSKYIIEAQKALGLEPIVVTRPGFPNDFYKHTILNSHDIYHESIKGIPYFRILTDEFMRCTPIKKYIDDFSRSIERIIELHKPDIVHATSNYVIGMSALKAARSKNLPFIYEIRGFWELTKASKEPLYLNSEDFELTQIMETYLAKAADKVIVISRQLKQELINRQIPESKITIVPNGVDCSIFYPMNLNTLLAKKCGAAKCFTIGYIGSIQKYEGLQNLLKAVSLLIKKGYRRIKVIIIGEGEYRGDLEKLTHELNLKQYVSFMGRIPHEEAVKYYSIFDVCVYPRIKEKVTEIVTPLKPLEAMACGKVVIGPDLEAIKEIIIPYENGLIFDNTVIDLARKLELVIYDQELKRGLESNARKWVLDNRSWTKLVNIYNEVYEELLVQA